MPVAQAAPGTLEDVQAAEAARADAVIPQELDARALFDILGWETGAEPPEAPPPSSSFAVPPHHPPASRTSSGSELPSVIVDLDLELATMIDRVASGQADESAEAELLRQGDRAMRVVRTRFPGPVTFERARIATSPSPPRASECGPLLRLVARERKVALPFVLDWMSDRDPETRGWATHLVCELPYAEAIPHVLARLRDDDAAIRISAALAVSALGKVAPGPLADAIQPLASSADPDDRVSAIKAMAALRQANVVPQLLTALGDADPKVGSAARDALVQITWQDFDADADAWLRWWEQNGARHRIEWLIDSLTHEEAEIRRGSGEELRTLTREYFGYSGDLPPRDRDRAQQRYRDWWLTEGRNRFRRR
ncbi:MAG: HEAT repeat domain-containing protein [Myxococcales bacterium]|nr:HEAT repeat domain-containing protein [Myxococcales bacterium]